jgi:hypothetical protein
VQLPFAATPRAEEGLNAPVAITQHSALSSSKRLMRILRPVIEAATDLVAVGIADLFRCRAI